MSASTDMPGYTEGYSNPSKTRSKPKTAPIPGPFSFPGGIKMLYEIARERIAQGELSDNLVHILDDGEDLSSSLPADTNMSAYSETYYTLAQIAQGIADDLDDLVELAGVDPVPIHKALGKMKMSDYKRRSRGLKATLINLIKAQADIKSLCA
jgi:hypothetical protein